MDMIPPVTFTVPLAAAVPHKETPLEKRDSKKGRELAALTDLPGWDHFTERYRARAKWLREGAGMNMSKMTDEELGQRTRANHTAADLMLAELSYIEGIARQLEQKRIKPSGV